MEPNLDSDNTHETETASGKGNDTAIRQQSAFPPLPFPKLWPLFAGVLLGIVLRLVFSGRPGGLLSAMDSAFLLLAPLAVGAVTVYVAETRARRSWAYYAGSAALANLLFVAGTMLILIEGLICAVIIAPLFAIVGAVGGLIMGAVCRFTNWPKRAAYSFAVLPLFMGLILPSGAGHPFIGKVERTIQIEASAEKIWPQLLDAKNIQADEVGHAWMYRIGVPLPIAGVTEQTPEGLVRNVTMGKAIHFDQVATDWQANNFVRWQYRFAPDSFPPHALDDHVKIGGHYFDLIDTEYLIAPTGSKSASLTVRMHYRVSTQFNWYANGVAQILMGNFEDVILDFYRHRSEVAS